MSASFFNTGQNMRLKSGRRFFRRKKSQCKNVIFAAENARTYVDVTIRGRSLRFHPHTGTDITMISRRTRKKKLGCPLFGPFTMPLKTADGRPVKIGIRFSTEFSFRDRVTRRLSNDMEHVTESANQLGLEGCIQLPAYIKLRDKYHCQMVTW